MPKTPEFTEVVAGTPELLFGALKDHHEWVPQLIPEWFTVAKHHEVEGHKGGVSHYDIHEDKHDLHGGSSKIKVVMEDFNPSMLSYVVECQGDPRYSHLKFHVRFLPGPSPGTTYLKWIVDYAPASPETGAPDDALVNLPFASFKDLAAHLENQ